MTVGALRDPDGYAFTTEGAGWVGNGVRDRFTPSGPTRFADAAAWASEALAPDDVAFAAFTFDGSPGSALVVPEEVHAVRTDSAPPPDLGRVDGRIRYAGSSVDEVAWMEAVATATTRIRAGAYEKIVLARDLQVWAADELDPIGLAARLARRFPSCMTFLHERFVGSTPELLLRRDGRRVTSVVLAGTAAPDPASGRALLASAKDQAEHAFARDSALAALAPSCVELHADAEPWLLRLDNLQHLATRVTGLLDADHHVLELVGAMHPTAAVGGTPRDVAVADIRPLEQMDRARYAAPIGVVTGSGDGTFGIALRCAQLDGNRARLFAGCGIVADSLPDDELEETRLKLQAMQSVLAA
ncbi:isochorismate synthase MenF [Euzebya sp.]|uniref:isochorismate synthase n=1 Tax=Euzebya sp. TaxID=1971409 RepID=UPI003516C97A